MGLFGNGKQPTSAPPPVPTAAAQAPPNFEALLEQRLKLDAEIRQRQVVELDGLKKKIAALAAALGVTVADLLGITTVGVKKERKKREVKSKYKHPTEPLTWSGRGKPPQWMQELIDAGHSKEDYLIQRA